MNRLKCIAAAACIAVLTGTAGCEEKIGGGSQSIIAGATSTMSVYGIRAGGKLGFVIFTDLPTADTSASAGSSWTGEIRPAKGPVVEYQADADGVVINGARYEFSSGRVFLVNTEDGSVSSRQLDVPVGEKRHAAEFESISKQADVQAFLKG